jgi:hypothetical protein
MNFLLLVLVDLARSDERSPSVTVDRKPLEALIEDWLRRGEKITSLRLGACEKLPTPANQK